MSENSNPDLQSSISKSDRPLLTVRETGVNIQRQREIIKYICSQILDTYGNRTL